MKRILLLSLVLLLLSGCSVAPSKKYQPMSDATHLETFVVMQQWDINIKGKEFHAQIVAQSIEGGWQWILLNDFGQRQASITSQDGVLTIEEFQSSQITDYLDQLVMAWQLMFWPPELIQSSNQHKWICRLEDDRRILYFENQPYANISFSGHKISNMKVEYQSKDIRISLSSYPLI
jgi:Protein of unknown function (DUF3261)